LEGKMEELVEKSKGTVIEKYNDDEKWQGLYIISKWTEVKAGSM
jgi:hypothetical protein